MLKMRELMLKMREWANLECGATLGECKNVSVNAKSSLAAILALQVSVILSTFEAKNNKRLLTKL